MNLHQMREKVLPKLLHNSQTFKSNCTIPDSETCVNIEKERKKTNGII